MKRIESRLAKLKTAIRPPAEGELSADERAVLAMLVLTRCLLPDWLRQAEHWHASGRPPCSQTSHGSARIGGVFEAICEANTRVGELMEQGRLDSIVERLKAWGHWQEPYPPPPDAATIITRLKQLAWGGDEADRKPIGEA